MIRKAVHEDVDYVVMMGKRAHAKSDWSHFPFNDIDARIFASTAIATKTMCVYVSVNNGKFDGLLIGLEQPMPFNKRVKSATDYFTFSMKRGVADQLVKAFMKWATEHRKVNEVFMMASQMRSAKWMDGILTSNGLNPVGRGYVRQLK
jgi:hypothetical protein